MSTETTSRIAVPEIKIYGIGDIHRLLPYVFEGQVGTEIEHLGIKKPLSELHKYSGALRDLRALYEIGFARKLGEDLGLPKEATEAGETVYRVFNIVSRGNATDDAADYKNAPKLKKVLQSDRPVRWIVHPIGFKETQKCWEVILGGKSEIHDILVPGSGYAEITEDGLYRPDTGTPFAATEKKKAIKSMVKRGIPKELAENEVSYFYSMEGNGVAAVCRWYGSAGDGPFGVLASYEPWGRNPGLGSFYANRSAERSEARPEDNGIKTLSLDAYRAFESDRETLALRQQELKTLKDQLKRLSE